MKKITQIVAENLVSLRKINNMTQGELASKLQYSDNTISRWEIGEASPSIEVLEKIAQIYNVPIDFLFKEHIKKDIEKDERLQKINKLSSMLLMVSVVWFVATIVYTYVQTFFNKNYWTIFLWAVPISCLVFLLFNEFWGKYMYKFIILSVFTWSLLLCLFFQFFEYRLWLIFLAGIPTQFGIVVWSFVKPKEYKNKDSFK